jgi:hypothetical protein
VRSVVNSGHQTIHATSPLPWNHQLKAARDYVKITDTVGDVIEKTLLVTRIKRSPKQIRAFEKKNKRPIREDERIMVHPVHAYL